jgi:hypothetical protein
MPATGSVTVVAYATVATAVTGLAAPIGSVSATIVVRDVLSELAAKNAELAAANSALAAEKAGRAADKAAVDSATATLGTKEQTVTMPATGSVTVVAYATVATAVTGLAAPVGSVSATIAVRDIAGELAAKNAEVASLTAQLAAEKAGRAADKVASDKALADAKVASDAIIASIKKSFNDLAKKWNKKNPRAKVTLIK